MKVDNVKESHHPEHVVNGHSSIPDSMPTAESANNESNHNFVMPEHPINSTTDECMKLGMFLVC